MSAEIFGPMMGLEDDRDRLLAEIERLRTALEFYAKPIHWMGLTEDSEARTSFVAAKGKRMDGFWVASEVLAGRDP